MSEFVLLIAYYEIKIIHYKGVPIHAKFLVEEFRQFKLFLGVTTVVDAGSSGAMTFNGLKQLTCASASTRILAWLHVSNVGLAGAGCSGKEFGAGGECDSINAVNVRYVPTSISPFSKSYRTYMGLIGGITVKEYLLFTCYMY